MALEAEMNIRQENEKTILAVETSTSAASVALIRGKNILGEWTIVQEAHYSHILLKMIDGLLQQSRVPLSAVDFYAVSTGPGSFTGLRVGLATVRGLSTGRSKPVLGVPTLDAFASRLPLDTGLIRPAIPARRGEVYTALYRRLSPEKIERMETPEIITVQKMMEELKGPVYLLGNFPSVFPPLRHPSAVSVALSALTSLEEGREERNPEVLLPDFPAGKARKDGLFL
ncbi:MAG TPA: tRNA (adenosine(37)-N6)-threonylcarbamoyltransferase complex dimerization subunit type 1 TsaB [Nitrospiria bacterium]|nr:tRNA (adenosine(37)-N6)-threonylcarbamoyltransferase complex dimerization subunit type 1 TsaB [Nitrospiria bacterium]